MFRKMTLPLLFCFFWFASVTAYQLDFVTYDWLIDLAEQTSYSDHIPHWRRLFNTMKVRGFLECGCGYSTNYFLDNTEKVVSIEYMNLGYGDAWYQVCLKDLGDRPNWVPMAYNGDYRNDNFNIACAYQCSVHKDYALIDPTYFEELDLHIKEVLSNAKAGGYEIDVAFVDPGVYLRGDLVKIMLKNDVPIVAAHDTASDIGSLQEENLYGWNKVVTPPNYVKIYIPFGQGTTFWINEKYPSVIASMIAYRDSIIRAEDSGQKVIAKHLVELADMRHFLGR